MDQDDTWHGGRPWSTPHCARWGHSSPPQKREQSPQFSVHLYCGQTAGCIKIPLGMKVRLSPGDIVFDVQTHLPPEKRHTHCSPCTKRGGAPQFSAVYCGQTAAWIKMPLGTEVGLGLRDIVFDVQTHLPPEKRHTHCSPCTKRGGAPNFRPSIVAK